MKRALFGGRTAFLANAKSNTTTSLAQNTQSGTRRLFSSSKLSPMGSKPSTTPTSSYGRKHYAKPGAVDLKHAAVEQHKARSKQAAELAKEKPKKKDYHPTNTYSASYHPADKQLSVWLTEPDPKTGKVRNVLFTPSTEIVSTHQANAGSPVTVSSPAKGRSSSSGFMVSVPYVKGKGTDLHHERVDDSLPLSVDERYKHLPLSPEERKERSILGSAPVLDPAVEKRARSMGWVPGSERKKKDEL